MNKPSSFPQHLPFFVYGTLKQGEERSPLWPHPPVQVELAVTRGRLFDLGPYPALVEGNDLILGELWHLAAEHLAATVATLDAVEIYDQGGADLYLRRIITCQTDGGSTCRAYSYLYAEPEQIAGFPTVAPDATGRCWWRPGK